EAPDVGVEERAPSLTRRGWTADQVLGARGLGDLEAELLEFAVDPGCAPQGVGASHGADQRAELGGDGGAAGPGPAALPGPEQPEACPLPPDDGLGFDEQDGLRPAVPQGGGDGPKTPAGGGG